MAAWNYEIQQMSFIPSFSFLQLKLTLFLIQESQSINNKVEGHSANGN